MPRKPRNSPNPPGRPPKKAQAEAALARAEKTGESIEEAAKKTGVTDRTVRAHKAAATKAPSSAPSVELPQGGSAVSTRPDLLEVLRRIGKARNAAAWAEVEEGLLVHQRGDAEAFAAWLARPIEAVEIDEDELATLREGLGVAVAVSRTAEAGGPQLRALTIVERLGKSIATVKARRPAEPKPDAVAEAQRREADDCVDHLLRHHAAVEQEWGELLGELRPFLGHAAPALRQRLDALLGGTTI